MKDLVIILFLAASLVCNSCSGQDNKIREQGKAISPRIDSKVNREYDENGNLKSYDSTYTYSYNFPDSLPGMFRKHFNNKLFPDDSTFFGDFRNDPFLKNFFDHKGMFQDPFFDDHAGSDTTSKHVPRIIGPDEYMFNSDRFRQMFRYFDSLNKNFFMNRDFDPEKFFKKGESGKSKKQNNMVL